MATVRDERRFAEDMLFLDQHRQQLIEKYPEQWVAVYRRQVVGAAQDLRELIEQLVRQGVSPGEVYREFLTRDEGLLILASK